MANGYVQRATSWFTPSPPDALRVEVEHRQWLRVRSYVPLLYFVASLNLLIIASVCAHNDVPLRHYGWLFGLVLMSVVRTWWWRRQQVPTIAPAMVSKTIRRSALLSGTALCVLGVFTSATYVLGTFERSTLMPISLAFGSMSIAHCFATFRPSAFGAIVFGIVMPAIAMLVVGDFDARILAVSMLSIGALMLRFVDGQYEQLVTEVRLQREVHDLANTDALTQLPNRRAVMAMVATELSTSGNVFAIALLDLDGFKGINDRLGHLAGETAGRHCRAPWWR
jgi:diguanylate cyclase